MRTLIALALLTACSGQPASPSVDAPSADKTTEPVQSTQADLIEVSGAWVRLMPPTAKNTGMFADFQNKGASLVQVTAAASDAAGTVELHTHVEEDGAMKMRRVESFDVPGQGHHHLEPGGDHIMFIGVTAPLTEGQQVDVTLTFADGSTKVVSAPVKAMDTSAGEAAAGANDHGHGHGAHHH